MFDIPGLSVMYGFDNNLTEIMDRSIHFIESLLLQRLQWAAHELLFLNHHHGYSDNNNTG